jgi:transcription initiation factor TFIID TATA-box-binding protein
MKKRLYSALSIDELSFLPSESESDAPPAFIHNIVSTTKIRSSVVPLNLNYIASVLPNSFYDKHKFAAITIRIDNPTCTVLLFSSGKLVLTGSQSWYKCLHASLKIVEMLRAYIIGVDFHVEDIVVQNIVGNAIIDLEGNRTLNLERMYNEQCSKCTFQKSLFPGLIYRPDNSPVVLLCFESGKVVITGGKCVDDIEIGWRRLWPVVKRYIE